MCVCVLLIDFGKTEKPHTDLRCAGAAAPSLTRLESPAKTVPFLKAPIPPGEEARKVFCR